MKIAITGASGFVGKNVAQILKQQGHECLSISRRDGIPIDDEEGLNLALQGCEAIIHCAGINREIGAQTYERVHVEGTQNIVRAAQKNGICKIILMSFLRARPHCGSAYHESKWEAEQIVRQSGIDYTILKAGVIYGRGDHMLDHLSHAFYTFPLFALVGMKKKWVRPVAVEEVAQLMVTALQDPRLRNKTIPVLGPELLTLQEAVQRVAQVVGKKPLFFRMPLFFHYALAYMTERLMKIPLLALAQARILSEGIVEAAGLWDDLPWDLQPSTPFTREQIQRGLPDSGPFGLKDLQWNAPHCCQ